MKRSEIGCRIPHTAPLLLALASAFTAAGGVVHLREWLDVYRDLPAATPGAALVRVGFPINAGVSLVLALALVVCAARRSRFTPHIVVSALVFEASSLAVLIGTRTGSVLGWAEPIWTRGANQSRAVEAGALLVLAAFGAISLQERRVAQLDAARLLTPSR